ncbi:MAG: tetratricopeptide repeat protein [Saprospiraceae bacterium]|nr:tetratricopeptide repeat protein [Saprospiraceae bacterium]
MKQVIIWLVLFLLSGPLLANQGLIDSLELLLVSEENPQIQLQLRNKIAFNYYRNNPDKTVRMSLENIKMAEEIGDEEGRLSAMNNLAVGQVFQNKSQKALETFKLLEEDGRKSGFMTIVHRACNNQGSIFRDLGQTESAIEAYQEAFTIAKMQKDDEAYCLYLNNLVSLLIDQGEFEKAQRYYDNAMPVASNLENKSVLAIITHGLGNLYEKTDRYALASEQFKDALRISRATGDTQSEIQALSSLARIEQNKGNSKKTLQYNLEAYELAKDYGAARVLTETYLALAKNYFDRKDLNKTVEMSVLGLEEAHKAMNLAIQAEFYKLLSKAKEGQSEFPLALHYHKLFKAKEDSLAVASQKQKIKELTLKYDLKEKDEENFRLRQNQERQTLELKQRTIIVFLVGLGLFLVSLIALLLYRNNRRRVLYNQELKEEVKLAIKDLETSNHQLKMSNRELERFTHIASHDLKEPLRNITSFVRLIERRLVGKNEGLREYLQFVQNNAKQMHILIEDVLEFSKLSKFNPVFEQIEVGNVIKQVSMAMETFLKERNASLLFDEMPDIYSSESQLYILFKNIIENGIIFNDSPHPRVLVTYKLKDGYHVFSFKDNGIGIEEKYQKKIFGMFDRLHGRVKHKGSGLGLSICKKIVQRLQGQISVESKKDKGSTFIIKLPQELDLDNKSNVTIQFNPKSLEKEPVTEQVN